MKLISALVWLLLLLWGGYWLHAYLTAPTPDYEMQSVAAILFGPPPIVLAALIWLLRVIWRKLSSR